VREGFDEVVLLTGFPSFRARRMAEEIVTAEGPRALVHAVVHPKLRDEAMSALDVLPLDARRRVQLVEGDAAAMDLGLSGAELRAFAREIDVIHHCVQVSYLGAERADAEHVNVGSAYEVIELAKVCKQLRCLVVHSSASVSGDRSGLVREEDLDCGQRFRNPVEETLARAERVYRRVMHSRHRVPIAVLRPTIVVGDSQTGEVDRLDGPYLLILLMLAAPPDFMLPLPTHLGGELNLVPIDFVTRAALRISRDPRAVGRTLHLVDPHPLPSRKLVELVARAGGRRVPSTFLPANLMRALLRAPGLERIAKSPRAFLDAMMVPVKYDHAGADELLAGSGIVCPPLDSYIEALVTHVQKWLDTRATRRDAEQHDPLA
jgi:nucleoside-diphosphate-sugar epimerase